MHVAETQAGGRESSGWCRDSWGDAGGGAGAGMAEGVLGQVLGQGRLRVSWGKCWGRDG